MIELEIKNLSKIFDQNELPAVHDVSFSLEKGEILALVGPSGCGKTTTLRMIAGFEHPDSGSVILDGRVVADGRRFTPPEQRGVGMVFQEHALFPHLTVIENVAFGLAGQPKESASQKAAKMLSLLGLERLSNRYPHELSGGERQRVALARAVAPQPIVLLLDEPFTGLDADLRKQVREEVRVILKAIEATAIFVTHDQEEALFMGDRLAVFNNGRLEQIGAPEEIFHAPATRFVAEFMGQSDFLPGMITPHGIMTEIGLLDQKMELPPGSQVEIAVRADDINFDLQEGAGGLIISRRFQGALNIYRLRLPSGVILHAYQPHTLILKPGMQVNVRPDAGHPLTCFFNGKAVPLEQGHDQPGEISRYALLPAK